ncbi:MAG: tripartite tricarboxylate transporter substrate-binding protein [Xanthobacteraceae bacterium]
MSARMAIVAVLAALGTIGIVLSASASDYPNHPVTIVVPFSAGGPTDVIARIVGDHMGKTLGQPVRIANIRGDGGTKGATRAKDAAADGYTIIMGHMGTHAAAVSLYPHLAYDPEKDFAPIGLVAGTPILIVARMDLPARNLKEFIHYLKANIHKVKAAHAGVGSVSYATCALFNAMIGVAPAAEPFDGTGPAMNALLGGQIDYMCDQVVNLVSQVEGGVARAYAVATPERNPVLPRVPTTREAGLPDFQVSAWNALFAPAGTPQPVLDRLTEALDKALDDPLTRRRLLDLGSDVPDGPRRGQKALAELVKSEIARWTILKKVQWLN